MKPAEIQKMSNRDLRTAIAKATGIYHKPGHGSCCTCQSCGEHYDDCNCDCPDDLDACHAAEERLREKGNGWKFFKALERATMVMGLNRETYLWRIAHASARQRAEAILMAVQEGEAP